MLIEEQTMLFYRYHHNLYRWGKCQITNDYTFPSFSHSNYNLQAAKHVTCWMMKVFLLMLLFQIDFTPHYISISFLER